MTIKGALLILLLTGIVVAVMEVIGRRGARKNLEEEE
jgi:hypothetical protein